MLWLFAGHDSTGYSMGTLLLRLAENPAEMLKLRTAIRKVDAESEYMNLDEVQNVVKESNRLMAVASNVTMRKVAADVTTPEGYLIPKGTTAFIPQHLANHDSKTYESPDLFLPDRWNNATKEMFDAHMPFAVGVRSCPGLSLAKVEMCHIIPRLIRDLSWSVHESQCSS